ncbi:putative divalent ion tolerance protein, CutA [Medicago truncatula]|uniref:Divalent cation tolerance protein, CutA1 family protein n=1 Tax=Medicago truncatula TaxID=3880 RepID=G7J568_MEDTR|nr:protein CutA 1, chloroplastic isoform X1 [Medicago truncatula]AES73193.2 divalent cation tolerance protein, CutA1 family protein [Medicago truncatula]AFK35990.1 unknown [Medicago truncatula]RHN70218.1 putative divalent ion tolerance protein, CutA [Medicago truncatula]
MFSTKMASSTSRIFSSPSTLRRRLPIVGAFCMLTLGLTNFYTPLYSSALKTESKLSSRFSTKSSNFIRMEGNTNNTTVPSIVVYVTVPNKEAGKKLAESIVTEKLAACVNRVPGIESVYQWEGKIQTDSEELLIIKTRQSLLEALTDHVKANHEYDVPEVISLPITGGNLKYLEWLKESTRE